MPETIPRLMSTGLRVRTRVACILLAALLLSGCSIFSTRDLPSDEKALKYFTKHESRLKEIALEITHQEWKRLVDGSEFSPKLFKFAHHDKELKLVKFTIWGFGCVICHDSYKGLFYLLPGGRLPKHFIIVEGLEDADLPRGVSGKVVNGVYVMPIEKNWYMYRSEIPG